MPVEFVTLAASDKFLADPKGTSKPGLDLMLKQPGVIAPVYTAIQHEDKKTGYFLVNWETIEKHYDLAQSPDLASIMAFLGEVTSQPTETVHVEFNADHGAALSAATTEIAVIKLKPETTKEAFFEIYDRLIENLRKESAPRSITWGETVEHKGTYVLLIGWDSVEAHVTTVSKEPFTSIIPALHAAADINLTHASFITSGQK